MRPAASPSLLCQRCGRRNPAQSESCRSCGFKLYALAPGNAREALETSTFADAEEFVISKLSALEKHMGRSSEEVDLLVHALDYLERNVMANRAGIHVLASMLREAELLDARAFDRRWLERTVHNLAELERKERFLAKKNDIQAAFQGKHPRRFEERVDRAEDLFYTLESEQALQALEEAHSLSQANLPLAAFLGEAFLDAGRLEKAGVYLAKANASSAPPAGSQAAYSLLLLKRERPGEAAEVLVRNLGKHPSDGESLTYLALAHALAGEWGECRRRSAEAQKYAEGPAPLYLEAQAWLREGKTAPGEACLERLLALHPECEEAVLQQALLYLERGWWKRARSSFDRLETLNPRRDVGGLFERMRRAGREERKRECLLPISVERVLDMMGSAREEARMLLRTKDEG